MLPVTCPHCRRPLRVPPQAAGFTVGCPHCGQGFLLQDSPRRDPFRLLLTAALLVVGYGGTAACVGLGLTGRWPGWFLAIPFFLLAVWGTKRAGG